MNGELNACFLSKIWCCRHFNGEKFLVLFAPRLDWSARLRERSESPDFSKVATTPNQFCGTQRGAAPKLLNLGTTADHVWGRTNRLIGAGHKTARIDLFPFCRWLLLSKTRDGAPKGYLFSRFGLRNFFGLRPLLLFGKHMVVVWSGSLASAQSYLLLEVNKLLAANENKLKQLLMLGDKKESMTLAHRIKLALPVYKSCLL